MKNKPTFKDLYVSEISFDVEEEDLMKLFSICGRVRSIHMITDHKSGLFKGRAFVHMASAAEAKDAVNSLDGTYLVDRCISVTAAQPRKPTVKTAPAVTEKKPTAHKPLARRKPAKR